MLSIERVSKDILPQYRTKYVAYNGDPNNYWFVLKQAFLFTWFTAGNRGLAKDIFLREIVNFLKMEKRKTDSRLNLKPWWGLLFLREKYDAEKVPTNPLDACEELFVWSILKQMEYGQDLIEQSKITDKLIKSRMMLVSEIMTEYSDIDEAINCLRCLTNTRFDEAKYQDAFLAFKRYVGEIREDILDLKSEFTDEQKYIAKLTKDVYELTLYGKPNMWFRIY